MPRLCAAYAALPRQRVMVALAQLTVWHGLSCCHLWHCGHLAPHHWLCSSTQAGSWSTGGGPVTLNALRRGSPYGSPAPSAVLARTSYQLCSASCICEKPGEWGTQILLQALALKLSPMESLTVISDYFSQGLCSLGFSMHETDQFGILQNWRREDPFSTSVVLNKCYGPIKYHTW